MPLKPSLLFFTFFLVHQPVYPGCIMGSVATSYGTCYMYDLYGKGAKVQARGNATFWINVKGNIGCNYRVYDVKFVFEGDTVFRQSGEAFSAHAILPETPGRYTTICRHSHLGSRYVSEFDLLPFVMLPLPDSSSIHQAQVSGINSVAVNLQMQIFPNPFLNDLTLISEGDRISNISIYNECGKKLISVDPYSEHAELPLGELPNGVYILKVATVSDKIVIRKFTKM